MADLDALMHRTLAGDLEAWQAFQAALEPTILAIARRHNGLRSKGLAALPDDLREITVTTLERLARDDFQNLRRFVERSAQSGPQVESLDGWLYGAVEFVIREHLRKRFGRAPKQPSTTAARVQPSKRDLQSYAGRIDDAALERVLLETIGMTTKVTVAQIFAYIEREFASDEAQAMGLYYVEERSFEEIARSLKLEDGKSAERLIRRLNARLRYHFAVQSGEEVSGT